MPPGRQRLNAADRAMRAVDRGVRQLGYPGFETLTLVCLAGRASPERLRDALKRFGELHPVSTARLVEDEGLGGPFWQPRPEAGLPLHEADLPAAGEEALLAHAGALLSAPSGAGLEVPLRFHLLHGADGRDVFAMHHNHTLLDHGRAVRVLQEIDRLAAGAAPENGAPAEPWKDPVWAHLRSFPLQRRRQAAADVKAVWRRSVAKGAVQVVPAAPRTGTADLNLAARQLDEGQTRAWRAAVVRACGWPSLSMALLGSAFRAIDRLAPPQKSGTLVAGIGLDLGPRPERAGLDNWVSMIPISARRDEVGDRDELARALSRQLRERLAGGADLGTLRFATAFGRRQRQALWVIDAFMRYAFSLWYAYFGPLDAVGEHFAGVPIADVFSAGPCWAPMGLTLLVSQYRGRLRLQLTHAPEVVPEGLANDFLGRLVDDLGRRA
jgi:hypothetical protein